MRTFTHVLPCPALMIDRRQKSTGVEWCLFISPLEFPAFRSILRFHLQRDAWRLGWSTMKLLVFSLALAIFAGSSARVVRDAPDPESDSKLYKLIDELEEFLDSISNATEKKWEHFKHSKTGKALIELLDDDEDEAKPEGKDKTSPEEEGDIVEAIIDTIGDAVDAADDVVVEIGNQAVPVIKEFGKAVVKALGKHLDPLIEKIEPHLERLLQALADKTQELDHKLEELLPQQLEALDHHAPHYIQKLAELDSKKKAAKI